MNITEKIEKYIRINEFYQQRYDPYDHMTQPKGLNVENMEQKIIFCSEMDGQISDGNWENSGPRNHYKAFGIPKDNVKVEPGNLGLTATNARRKYNFASGSLLSIVGDRILLKINLWKMYGDRVLPVIMGSSFPDSYAEFERSRKSRDKYYVEKHAKILGAGITPEMVEKAEKEGPYKMKDLKKDCKRLSEIVQMRAK